jgi:hypothetical protein
MVIARSKEAAFTGKLVRGAVDESCGVPVRSTYSSSGWGI